LLFTATLVVPVVDLTLSGKGIDFAVTQKKDAAPFSRRSLFLF
jgi:hypothetical protein